MSTKKEQPEKDRKTGKKKFFMALTAAAVCAGIVIIGLSSYGRYRMSKIPALSFREALEYTTKDNPDAVITVGIIKDGQISYTVYGENGKELPPELHTYEIGSLTKTFTAAMISKAIHENKIDINAAIDLYLPLPEGNAYPTVKELLTHTSGYKAYYFESPMVSNFLNGRNDFYGITQDMVISKAAKISLSGEKYKFNYSNYGYALLGLILEEVYKTDFKTLMNQFVQEELKLSDTQISLQDGDLSKYWDWNSDDAYLPAGALTSHMADMLAYARMQLDKYEYFGDCQESLEEINAVSEQYKMMCINMDEIGMAWIIDKHNGIIWHNGGTGNYNSYIGFNPETKAAVVVLSNLSPGYRIPATVLGVKLLTEL